MSDLEKLAHLPQDQRVLLTPLVRTTRCFWLWAALLAAITLWGGIAYCLQLRYGLGLTGMYLNVRGREEHGIVEPDQVRSLGATDRQAALTIMSEARLGVLVSLIAGFGGIISEVGAVMLVGGNIEGRTRVLTTAIVLETRKGNFELALALGFVLLGLTFAANLAMLRLQGRSIDE